MYISKISYYDYLISSEQNTLFELCISKIKYYDCLISRDKINC